MIRDFWLAMGLVCWVWATAVYLYATYPKPQPWWKWIGWSAMMGGSVTLAALGIAYLALVHKF